MFVCMFVLVKSLSKHDSSFFVKIQLLPSNSLLGFKFNPQVSHGHTETRQGHLLLS